MRVYLANRGVWDAIVGAGPTCSVAATDEDVEAYVAAFADLSLRTNPRMPLVAELSGLLESV